MFGVVAVIFLFPAIARQRCKDNRDMAPYLEGVQMTDLEGKKVKAKDADTGKEVVVD